MWTIELRHIHECDGRVSNTYPTFAAAYAVVSQWHPGFRAKCAIVPVKAGR